MKDEFSFGLALSGGGFRATLFHLGVVRFLHDSHLLEKVTHITSVSGGSILAAHLWENWDAYHENFDEAARPLLSFMQSDVRGRILRRFPFSCVYRNWSRTTLLTKYYDRGLYSKPVTLKRQPSDCPPKPRLCILTTNLNSGSMYAFGSGHLYGDVPRPPQTVLPIISRKVAISSAFPAFFPPVTLTHVDVALPEGDFEDALFTDGGVYDNLGIRFFQRAYDVREQRAESPEANDSSLFWSEMPSLVLVSNAGSAFDYRSGAMGLFGTASRAVEILLDRIGKLDLEEIIGVGDRRDERFWYLSLQDRVDTKDDATSMTVALQNLVSFVRTDLDRFSAFECRCLVHHGYCVGRARLKALKASLDRSAKGGALPEDREACHKALSDLPSEPPWDPFPGKKASSEQTPITGKPEEEHVLKQVKRQCEWLQRGARLRVRPLSVKDPWASFLLVASVCALVWLICFVLSAASRLLSVKEPSVIKRAEYSSEDRTFEVTFDQAALAGHDGEHLVLVVVKDSDVDPASEEDNERYLDDPKMVMSDKISVSERDRPPEWTVDCDVLRKELNVGDVIQCAAVFVPKDLELDRMKTLRQLKENGGSVNATVGVFVKPALHVIAGWGYSMEECEFGVSFDQAALAEHDGQDLVLVIVNDPRVDEEKEEKEEEEEEEKEDADSFLDDANIIKTDRIRISATNRPKRRIIDCEPLRKTIKVWDVIRCAAVFVPKDLELDRMKTLRQMKENGGSVNAIVGNMAVPHPSWEEDRSVEYMKANGTLRVRFSSTSEQGMLLFGEAGDFGGRRGYDIMVISNIADRLKEKLGLPKPVKLERSEVKWEELLDSPMQGEADVIISSISFLSSREEKHGLRFSVPYYSTTLSLVSVDEELSVVRTHLPEKRIGVQAKTTSQDIAEQLPEKYDGLTITPYENSESLKLALVNSEVDYIIVDTPFAEGLQLDATTNFRSAEFDWDDFPTSVPPDRRKEYYVIGVAAVSPKLLWAIDGILIDLAEEGVLQELQTKARDEYRKYKEKDGTTGQ